MPYEAKTDWKYDDLVTEKDMNRIEQGLKDAHVPAHQPLTLNPGLQVVEVENDTPFRMGEVKGRTLMNLSGREGNFDYRTSPLFTFFGSGEIIPVSTPVGTKVQKIVCNRAADSPGHFGARYELNIDRSKHYVAVAYLDNISCDEPVYFSFAEWKSTGYYTIRKSGNVKKGEGMQYRYIDISPDRLETQEKLVFYFRGEGTAGAEFRIGAFGLYEISQSEYEAIGKMKFAQVAERYPYVDSMTNVKNPYAIVTGGNLLPPFYEWTMTINQMKIRSPYHAQLLAGGDNTVFATDVKALPKTEFTLTAQHNGNINIGFLDADKNIISLAGYTTKQTLTVTTPPKTEFLRVYFSNLELGIKTYTISDPILTVGSEPKPFAPQLRSTLAFETELAAHPVDGSNPDTLFMGDDGLPYVLGPWGKVTLDGSLPYMYSQKNPSVKQISFPLSDAVRQNKGTTFVIKYDGKMLIDGGPTAWQDGGYFPDYMNVWLDGYLYLSIANTDSGWGPDYKPTQDEIRAYFLGWRLAPDDDWDAVYNGTGERVWLAITGASNWEWGDGSATKTQPTATHPKSIAAGWQPYRLQYLKAKPTVEPAGNYELGVTLSEGSNMVEVGSGIVLREVAKFNAGTAGEDAYIWNSIAYGSQAKSKVCSILQVYKGLSNFSQWWRSFHQTDSYGSVRGVIGSVDFDPTAVYHATYTMLDPTLAAPFSGTVAANLIGTVSDLVQDVGDIGRRLAVVENSDGDISSDGTVRGYDLEATNNLTVANNAGVDKDLFVKGNVTGGTGHFGTDGAGIAVNGATHSFINFHVGGVRSGYMGPADPAQKDDLYFVSERGSLNFVGSSIKFNGSDAVIRDNEVMFARGNAPVDFNTATKSGYYHVRNADAYQNAPPVSWAILEVVTFGPGAYTIQRVTASTTAETWQRTRTEALWQPWRKISDSRDIDSLKQSVVDGKGVIAGAINGKGGGPVSANSTFPELAAGVNRINTGGLVNSGPTKKIEKRDANTGREAFDLFTLPAGASEAIISAAEGSLSLYNAYAETNSYSRLSVRNQSGQSMYIIGDVAPDTSFYQDLRVSEVAFNKAKSRFYISGGSQSGGTTYEMTTSRLVQSGFNLNQSLTFYLEIYKESTRVGAVSATASIVKMMYV